MNARTHQRLTGTLFIVGAVLVNIPYTLLIMIFDYPDILRTQAGHILTRFNEGGPSLVFTWLAFAWTGFPLLAAIVMVQRLLDREDTPYLWAGTVVGMIGAVAQMVGLLRWAFVVPVLARTYVDPTTTAAGKESTVEIFRAVHQYGGVVLGEHIGQSFTIIWMVVISVAMFRSPLFKPWLAWCGITAAAVYSLAQAELIATVITGFPVVQGAGLVGSLLWLVWMIVLGSYLIRRTARAAPQHG